MDSTEEEPQLNSQKKYLPPYVWVPVLLIVVALAIFYVLINLDGGLVENFSGNDQTTIQEDSVIDDPLGPTGVIAIPPPRPIEVFPGGALFRNEELGYEFLYTLGLESLGTFIAKIRPNEVSPGGAITEAIFFEYTIRPGFISENQLALIGVTYCQANQDDTPRCENFSNDQGVSALIDWGDAGGPANVMINHPEGGMVTIDLSPKTEESINAFRFVFSSFKFIQ